MHPNVKLECGTELYPFGTPPTLFMFLDRNCAQKTGVDNFSQHRQTLSKFIVWACGQLWNTANYRFSFVFFISCALILSPASSLSSAILFSCCTVVVLGGPGKNIVTQETIGVWHKLSVNHACPKRNSKTLNSIEKPVLWTHGWRYFGGVFGVIGGFEMRELRCVWHYTRTQHMLHKTKHKTVNIIQNPRFGHRVGGTLLKVLVSREVLRMTCRYTTTRRQT